MPPPAGKYSQFGMVRFPAESPDYRAVGGGHTFVELWAVEAKRGSCGSGLGYGNIFGFMVESLAGTDTEANQEDIDRFFSMYRKGMDTRNYVRRHPVQERLFPDLTRMDGNCVHCKHASVPLLACVTMGSSDWRGIHRETEERWRCSYDDLDANGKKVYNSIDIAYPFSEIMLVTWVEY